MDRYFEQALEYLIDKEIAKKAGDCLPAFDIFDAGNYPDKLYRYRGGNKDDRLVSFFASILSSAGTNIEHNNAL